jgi:hypothetical protein
LLSGARRVRGPCRGFGPLGNALAPQGKAESVDPMAHGDSFHSPGGWARVGTQRVNHGPRQWTEEPGCWCFGVPQGSSIHDRPEASWSEEPDSTTEVQPFHPWGKGRGRCVGLLSCLGLGTHPGSENGSPWLSAPRNRRNDRAVVLFVRSTDLAPPGRLHMLARVSPTISPRRDVADESRVHESH